MLSIQIDNNQSEFDAIYLEIEDMKSVSSTILDSSLSQCLQTILQIKMIKILES